MEGKEIIDYKIFVLKFFEEFGIMLKTYKGVTGDWSTLVSLWNKNYGKIVNDSPAPGLLMRATSVALEKNGGAFAIGAVLASTANGRENRKTLIAYTTPLVHELFNGIYYKGRQSP